MGSAVAVRDRPILMSGPMVRAILDGRKTVTRRAVKHDTPSGSIRAFVNAGDGLWQVVSDEIKASHEFEWMRCPHGQPGDRLWVRETAWYDETFGGRVFYDGGTMQKRLGGGVVLASGKPNNIYQKRRPSIHMPRWASRLTLEITEVRVERLGDIDEEDATAEGSAKGGGYEYDTLDGTEWRGMTYVAGFRNLWDSLNATRGFGWDVNPWVWVLGFRKVEDRA